MIASLLLFAAHSGLVASCYGDMVTWANGHSVPLTMHWGDMKNTYRIMDKALAVLCGPILHQENVIQESISIGSMGGFIGNFAHGCNFPTEQRIKIAACMSEFGLTWQAADTTIDAVVTLLPGFRKRGETTKGLHLFSAEQIAWLVKCSWYLFAM